MTKKLISFLLAMLLMLSALPALGEEHGPLWIEGGEDVTLTYWAPIDSTSAQYYDTYAEHPFFLWMEEQTGVHVEFIHPAEEQMAQQFNLMMTSGNYYDMLYSVSYDDGPQAAIDDGVFADIARYEDLMPHYFAAIRCNNGSLYDWEWGIEKALYNLQPQGAFEPQLTTTQGNVWCVSQVWTEEIPTEAGAVIRQDWLDDAGLPMPETLEELEKVLAAFKARGEDVIPMTIGWNGANNSTGYVLSAFDIKLDWFSVTDQVVDPVGFATQAGKEYCQLITDWYQKGYIDPDFMNRDYETMEALFLTDRLGILSETWYAPDYYESLYAGSDEDFDVAAAPLVRKDKDQILRFKWGYESSACNHTVIAQSSKHKEVAAQWLDRLFTDEAYLRINYGVEGESYEFDENGRPYYTQWYYDNAYDMNLDALYMGPKLSVAYSNRANALKSVPDTSVLGQQTTQSAWYEATSVWGANATMDGLVGYVVFDGDGWAEMCSPYYSADSYANVQFMRFIIGTDDLSEYDDMIDTVLLFGYRKARDLMQKAYNVQHHLPEDFGMNIE